MPYDAFGNEIKQSDPLAGLGSPTGGPSGIPGGPKRRGPGAAIAVAVGVLVVIGIAVGLFVLGTTDSDTKSTGSTFTINSDTPEPDAPVAQAEEPVAEADPEPEPDPETPASAEPPAPVEPPTGLQPGSLLRRANLQVALQRLREEAKGRPRSVRVEALRVDAQVVLNDGRLRNAQATWDGEVRVISTTPTPIGGLETFSWSAVDPAAMPRLVRSASGRARKPASSFNYAVLNDASGLRWVAFLKTGEAFIASPGGSIQRQISG